MTLTRNTYQDIVNSFKVINKVTILGNNVVTKGIDLQGTEYIDISGYSHQQIAREVQSKVYNFIGIE